MEEGRWEMKDDSANDRNRFQGMRTLRVRRSEAEMGHAERECEALGQRPTNPLGDAILDGRRQMGDGR